MRVHVHSKDVPSEDIEYVDHDDVPVVHVDLVLVFIDHGGVLRFLVVAGGQLPDDLRRDDHHDVLVDVCLGERSVGPGGESGGVPRSCRDHDAGGAEGRLDLPWSVRSGWERGPCHFACWRICADRPGRGVALGGELVHSGDRRFTSAAATTMHDLGKGCSTTRPARESATGASLIAEEFEDPPGVAGDGIPSGGQYPANGMLLYEPKSTRPSASLATCALPQGQHDVCTAVLNHFVALYG
jgi:hypothetical protein